MAKRFCGFLVADRQFKKLDYYLWKNISKPVTNIVTIALISDTDIPTINICNDLSIIVLTNNDSSLGEFLFNNIFNEEEQNMANNIINDVAKVANYSDRLTNINASISNNAKTISCDVDISGNPYTETIANDWSASTTATNANIVDGLSYDSTSGWINIDLSTRPTFYDVEKMITDKINENNMKKEKEKMKGFNFDFGPCTDDQVRMSIYGLAVKNAAGTYVSYNTKSGEIVDVDVLNFDGARFMYKIPVAVKDIAVGDIIVHNRKPMFVIALPAEGANAITCVDVYAGEQKQIIPTVNMFGFNFITKIVSLFNTIGDNAPTPDAPFGNMLPFMLMSDEESDKINPIMMMFMMGNNKIDMNNPMLMYYMFKDNKDSDILPLFFMTQNK